VFTLDGGIQDLDYSYDQTTKAVKFSARKFSDTLKFSKISNIIYGKKGKDLNLC
jgi:hypothetical protein